MYSELFHRCITFYDFVQIDFLNKKRHIPEKVVQMQLAT